MIRPYKKQSKPAWQERLLLILGYLFGATLLMFLAWAVLLFVD